jgi:hypothetical protein
MGNVNAGGIMSAETNKRVSEGGSQGLVEGVILLGDGSTSVVRTELGDLRCERAASCLLEPVARDRVLVAQTSSGAYVLAVLVRDSNATVRLSAEGPIEIASRGGSIAMVARDDVKLVGGRAVTVGTKELAVSAEAGQLRIDSLGFVGKVADLSLGVMRTAAESIERVAGRAVERLGRSYRFVEEAEHLRARELDVRTEATLSLRAEHAVVHARKIVKMDGTQIHVG